MEATLGVSKRAQGFTLWQNDKAAVDVRRAPNLPRGRVSMSTPLFRELRTVDPHRWSKTERLEVGEDLVRAIGTLVPKSAHTRLPTGTLCQVTFADAEDGEKISVRGRVLTDRLPCERFEIPKKDGLNGMSSFGSVVLLDSREFDQVSAHLGVSPGSVAFYESETSSTVISRTRLGQAVPAHQASVLEVLARGFSLCRDRGNSPVEAILKSVGELRAKDLGEGELLSILRTYPVVERSAAVLSLRQRSQNGFVVREVITPLELDDLILNNRLKDYRAIASTLQVVDPVYHKEVREFLELGGLPSGATLDDGRTFEFVEVESRKDGDRSAKRALSTECVALRRHVIDGCSRGRLARWSSLLEADTVSKQTDRLRAIYSDKEFVAELASASPLLVPSYACQPPDLSAAISKDGGYVHIQFRFLEDIDGFSTSARVRWHTKIRDDKKWIPCLRVELDTLRKELIAVPAGSPLLDPVVVKALDATIHKVVDGQTLLWVAQDSVAGSNGRPSHRVRRIGKNGDERVALSDGSFASAQRLNKLVEEAGHFPYIPKGMEIFFDELYPKPNRRTVSGGGR